MSETSPASWEDVDRELEISQKAQKAEVLALLEILVLHLDQTIEHRFWGYTREYEAGQLAAALRIVKAVLAELKEEIQETSC